MFRERDEGIPGLMFHLSRNGHEQTVVAKYTEPEYEHFAAARKLDLSIEAIRKVMDPHLLTSKRRNIESLAYRLANPSIPLEDIARYGNLPVGLLYEDLQSAEETLQWAANALGMGELRNRSKVN